MPIIGRMKKLCYLDISGTHVTDAGLDLLNDLKDLAYLSCGSPSTDGSPITEDGLQRLKKALPKCNINGFSRRN